MFYELSDETKRLLDGDTANKANHMGTVPLGNLLHGVYFMEEVSPFTARGTCWYERCMYACDVCWCGCMSRVQSACGGG